MDYSEDVDFDFFDTPRKNVSESPTYTAGIDPSSKPPAGKFSPKRFSGEKTVVGKEQSKVNTGQGKDYYDSYSSDDSSVSGTDSETPRILRPTVNKVSKGMEGKETSKGRRISDSPESSSAYSDSDSYSEDFSEKDKGQGDGPGKNISVKLPKTSEAWAEKPLSQTDHRSRDKVSRHSSEILRNKKEGKGKKSVIDTNLDSDSDSSPEHNYRDRKQNSNKRHDAKVQNGKGKPEKQGRQPLKSTSSSHSNNSDITDVSPLESPDASPGESRKRYDRVQYVGSIPTEQGADIHLDSDKIDLSILMKCMADIDREKQQRLKANSRRVMFAPPSQLDKPKSNYTFSSNRARMIEKENQRLLQQIMQHVQPGPKKLKPGTATKPAPKKAIAPVIQRLTPSAVNRQREQQRIEMENLQILKRLQTVRATRGMSRQEQLHEFDRQATYGMPTCTMPTGARHFDQTMPYRETHSQMSGTSNVGNTQRSRPSSAKSNQSTGSRRSRPSSAKSNASIRSNASLRSNMSIRSAASRHRDEESRPPWDDRFAYS